MADFIEMMLTPSIVALNIGDCDSKPVGEVRTIDTAALINLYRLYREN